MSLRRHPLRPGPLHDQRAPGPPRPGKQHWAEQEEAVSVDHQRCRGALVAILRFDTVEPNLEVALATGGRLSDDLLATVRPDMRLRHQPLPQ